jgi:hypothetical protein
MFSLPTRHSYSAAAFSNTPLSTKWTERQTHFLIVLLSRLGVPCPPACLRGCSPPLLFLVGGGDHARWRGGGGPGCDILVCAPWVLSPGSRTCILENFLAICGYKTNISLKTRYCPLLLLLVPESGTRDPE